MIVRLKDEAARFERAAKRFQFYDSPIKSRSSGKSMTCPNGFNSMIVRLKDTGPVVAGVKFVVSIL